MASKVCPHCHQGWNGPSITRPCPDVIGKFDVPEEYYLNECVIEVGPIPAGYGANPMVTCILKQDKCEVCGGSGKKSQEEYVAEICKENGFSLNQETVPCPECINGTVWESQATGYHTEVTGLDSSGNPWTSEVADGYEMVEVTCQTCQGAGLISPTQAVNYYSSRESFAESMLQSRQKAFIGRTKSKLKVMGIDARHRLWLKTPEGQAWSEKAKIDYEANKLAEIERKAKQNAERLAKKSWDEKYSLNYKPSQWKLVSEVATIVGFVCDIPALLFILALPIFLGFVSERPDTLTPLLEYLIFPITVGVACVVVVVSAFVIWLQAENKENDLYEDYKAEMIQRLTAEYLSMAKE